MEKRHRHLEHFRQLARGQEVQSVFPQLIAIDPRPTTNW
jgi:hypothetical protein